jgi:plasmid stabilization system protein ParE
MARARRIVWAPRAKQDLVDIWRYYARVASAEVADNILREIEQVADAIGRNPLARRLREELGPGLRSALVSPHIIFTGFGVGRFRSCASCTKGGIFPRFLPSAGDGRNRADLRAEAVARAPRLAGGSTAIRQDSDAGHFEATHILPPERHSQACRRGLRAVRHPYALSCSATFISSPMTSAIRAGSPAR